MGASAGSGEHPGHPPGRPAHRDGDDTGSCGVFDYLSWMARLGIGGPVAGGQQYVSWIHGDDFVRAVQFLLARDDLDGPVTSPHRTRCGSAT
jgi:hypothetical protein